MIVASRVLRLLSKRATTRFTHLAAVAAASDACSSSQQQQQQRCRLTTDSGGGIGLHNVKDRKLFSKILLLLE